VLSDKVTAGYAGPRAPLCTFTTGPAGRVYLDLRMYLCDPETGRYVCLRAGRGFLVVEELTERSDGRSLVGKEIASRAGRGVLSPEEIAAGVEAAPAGLAWLARLAVLAAAVGLDPPTWPSADLDGDGDVDLVDYALLANSFDATGGATYTWDAENRLVAVTPLAPTASDRKVEFGYDYLGRRVVKRVYVWNGSAWVAPQGATECAVRKFIYDGWRVIMELDGSNGDAVLRKHTWGLDLSGSLEGAGGIGGLLGTLDTAGTTDPGDERTFIYFYDANGNVGQLVETTFGPTCGTIAAHYVYTPYGARLNAAGQNEYGQPFRFSTKWFDAETALGYWGYRYYSPESGRWLSRDPLKEDIGGYNLYAYTGNRPVAVTDPLGGCSRLTPEDKAHMAKALADAKNALRSKCTAEGCCLCKTDSEHCEEDADKIVKALTNVLKNWGNGDNRSNDNVGGYLCWDWCRAFHEAAKSVKSDYWEVDRARLRHVDETKKSRPLHYYVKLSACHTRQSQCQVMIDDGWLNPGAWNFVHKDPWPGDNPNYEPIEFEEPRECDPDAPESDQDFRYTCPPIEACP